MQPTEYFLGKGTLTVVNLETGEELAKFDSQCLSVKVDTIPVAHYTDIQDPPKPRILSVLI